MNDVVVFETLELVVGKDVVMVYAIQELVDDDLLMNPLPVDAC